MRVNSPIRSFNDVIHNGVCWALQTGENSGSTSLPQAKNFLAGYMNIFFHTAWEIRMDSGSLSR